ncbi:hypothetical protein LVJ94_34485 [Pendulispora rubella]|uniref:Uncharacterized protein n=1 Tax=Pendulispora rubella TaxID=2741070 RepID=A0ABZ2KW67_9BACT
MLFFRELGGDIDRAWRAENYDVSAFPRIARIALSERPPSKNVTPDEIVEWTLTTGEFPRQPNLDIAFGDPPITVFCAQRFYIEALFWVDGTTAIHQHNFSGAFHVLSGSSIHARYAFHLDKRFSERLLSGSLRLTDIELLEKGDTRPIESGDRFIHSLFHLDRPSVTIVARTFSEPSATPQYSYSKPSLAHDSAFNGEQLKRQVQSLVLLYESEHPEATAIVRKALARADALTTYRLLRAAHQAAPKASFEALLEDARARDAHLVERLEAVFEQDRRLHLIVGRRKKVRDAEHRFFLALLLNAPDRKNLLNLVRRRYPEHDPLDVVARWVRQMATTQLEGDSEPNVLGLPLDSAGIDVLEYTVRALSHEEIVRRLQHTYDEDDIRDQQSDIVELEKSIRSMLLFRPLFTE